MWASKGELTELFPSFLFPIVFLNCGCYGNIWFLNFLLSYNWKIEIGLVCCLSILIKFLQNCLFRNAIRFVIRINYVQMLDLISCHGNINCTFV